MTKSIRWTAILLVAIHFVGGHAPASTWDVNGVGSWVDDTNWSGDTEPDRSPPIDADINFGNPQVYGGMVAEADDLRLTGNAQLSVFTLPAGNGQLFTNEASIGVSGSPAVSVYGTNSAWVNEGNLTVGYRDHGSNPAVLTIQDGGAVSTNTAIIGDYGHGLGFSSGWGVVTVKGAGARFNV